MKVLITGSKGQLGNEFLKLYYEKGDVDVIGIDKADVDISDEIKIKRFVLDYKPNLILHCAAYTNVDNSELNKEVVFKTNVDATRYLAEVSNDLNSAIVYISTDYVFDGKKKEAYIETDKTRPLNYYGYTKMLGENIIKDLCPKYFIIRTSWLYGAGGNNFLKTILNLAKNRSDIDVVFDQIGTPTYVVDLTKSIFNILDKNYYGIYHISNDGQTSWYDFAKKIFEYSNINIRLNPITTQALNRPAIRPLFSVLAKEKYISITNIVPRKWEEALKECIENSS